MLVWWSRAAARASRRKRKRHLASPATVAGNTYRRVIKVKYTYIGNIGLGDIVVAEEERWYAKGFGLIYDKFDNLQLGTTQEFETTRIAIF